MTPTRERDKATFDGNAPGSRAVLDAGSGDIILFRRGPYGQMDANLGRPLYEGEPYQAGIVTSDNQCFALLYLGAHDTGTGLPLFNKLVGGGFQLLTDALGNPLAARSYAACSFSCSQLRCLPHRRGGVPSGRISGAEWRWRALCGRLRQRWGGSRRRL
jgi:hypothetical protein